MQEGHAGGACRRGMQEGHAGGACRRGMQEPTEGPVYNGLSEYYYIIIMNW